jgi:hypothetical protein
MLGSFPVARGASADLLETTEPAQGGLATAIGHRRDARSPTSVCLERVLGMLPLSLLRRSVAPSRPGSQAAPALATASEGERLEKADPDACGCPVHDAVVQIPLRPIVLAWSIAPSAPV